MTNKYLKPEFRKYRRAFPRFSIQCRAPGQSASQSVEVRDISAGGARIHAAKDVPVGTQMALEFRRPDLGLDETLQGEVVWTRRDADQAAFNIGIRFLGTDTFPAEQLFEKVSKLPSEPEQPVEPLPAEERRLAPRVQERCPLRYRPAPAGWFSPWFSGSVVDLSGSGLAFSAGEEVKDRSFLEIELSLPGHAGKVRARALVVRSERKEGPAWSVGVHFVEMPEEHQRLLAGHVAEALQRRLEGS
jgi:c-di-GMP-binding flagellar brake protein YcgR